MALDPKKWTVKTQEAFAAAIDLAKTHHNPELTPDHLLVALAGQDGTVVAPVLAKLGQSPGMVRDRALAAVERLPSAIGGDEPHLGKKRRSLRARRSQPRLGQGGKRQTKEGGPAAERQVAHRATIAETVTAHAPARASG